MLTEMLTTPQVAETVNVSLSQPLSNKNVDLVDPVDHFLEPVSSTSAVDVNLVNNGQHGQQVNILFETSSQSDVDRVDRGSTFGQHLVNISTGTTADVDDDQDGCDRTFFAKNFTEVRFNLNLTYTGQARVCEIKFEPHLYTNFLARE